MILTLSGAEQYYGDSIELHFQVFLTYSHSRTIFCHEFPVTIAHLLTLLAQWRSATSAAQFHPCPDPSSIHTTSAHSPANPGRKSHHLPFPPSRTLRKIRAVACFLSRFADPGPFPLAPLKFLAVHTEGSLLMGLRVSYDVSRGWASGASLTNHGTVCREGSQVVEVRYQMFWVHDGKWRRLLRRCIYSIISCFSSFLLSRQISAIQLSISQLNHTHTTPLFV